MKKLLLLFIACCLFIPSIRAATMRLHGTVYAPNSTDYLTVYLLRKDVDHATGFITLTAIDSINTNFGGVYQKDYPAIPAGILYLKAVVPKTNLRYGGYLPSYFNNTFYNNALTWDNGAPLSADNFDTTATYQSPTNLSLLQTGYASTAGKGSISGTVVSGVNRSANTGDRPSNRILILVSQLTQVITFTFSDANGHFAFANLPDETYAIFGDSWGRTNPVLNITVGPTQQVVSDVIFEENNTQFFGYTGNLSAGSGPAALQGVRVFPNPVQNDLQISGLPAIPGSKQITLSDVTGRTIRTRHIAPDCTDILAMDLLPAGVYILRVRTVLGDGVYQIVKQVQ